MMSFLTFPLPSHADAVSDGAPIAGAVQRRITGPLALLRSPGIPFFSKPGLTEFPDWCGSLQPLSPSNQSQFLEGHSVQRVL